ncbi:hypothetical protein Fmac_032236 [Flemingia macrophylla]|uniref:C2H2-type domain-containing protein n=1 Tax=Flemingia macrophylla TaxID=520843 RepID=A0ABD1L4B3_9FABA
MAGSNRKEKNTIPVELAIQREMEYRRIVASFQLSPKTDPNFAEEELKSSPDASYPPSSRNSPSLSGSKRKEPPTRITSHQDLKPQQPFHESFNHKGVWDINLNDSYHQCHPKSCPSPSSSKFSLETKGKKESPTRSVHLPNLQHHQQPFHGSLNHKFNRDDLFCKICQIFCSSAFNLKQHFNGQKHNRKLQMGKSNRMQWCEVCSVTCMDEDLLKLHLQGQRHKTKLKMLEISKEGGEAPNRPKWCEQCKLWCSDEFAFKQHLEGKKHIFTLHTMEKINK